MAVATTLVHEGSAILGAANWLEGLIHSPAVTGIAVLAIAATGFSMLSGRIPVRRGLTVAFGCFILFGAPAIARGLVGSVSGTSGEPAEIPSPTSFPMPPAPVPRAAPTGTPPPVSDPYAGASVP